MKQIYFSTIILILLSLNSFSQNVDFPGRAELDKLKKEMSNLNKINEVNTLNVPTNSLNNDRLGINDFGNPADWDWIKTFGGSGRDLIREMKTTNDGSIIVAGSFSGEISIASNNYVSTGRRDGFLAKLQSDGTLVWFEQFAATTENTIDIYGLSIDGAGNCFITGYYTGEVSFGDYNLSNENEMNLFVATTNSQGQVTMATQHSTDNSKELGLKVDTDNDGNIYVLASTNGTTNRTHTSAVIKYSSDGSLLLEYTHDQCFNDMQIFGEHIYFTGTINSADYIGDNYFDPAKWSAFIAQSNLQMEFNWSYMIESEYSDATSEGLGLYVSAEEDVFFVGTSFSITDITLGTISADISGSYVAKLNYSGSVMWMWRVLESGGTSYDITASDTKIFVSSYVEDAYFVTKLNKSTGAYINRIISDYKTECLSYNPIIDCIISSQNKDEEINLVANLTTTLTEQWSLLFDGNSAQTYGIGMEMDQNGFLYNYGYASNNISISGQEFVKGLFLTKQDGTGNIIWKVQLPNAKDNSQLPGNYFAIDTTTNSIYIAGTFYQFLFIPDGPTLIADYPGETFIIKYNFDGEFQWAKQEDFISNGLSLKTDNSGNLIVGGPFSGTINIGGNDLVSPNGNNLFVVKYDNTGQIEWIKSIGSEYAAEMSCFLSTDAQDNIYLTGESMSPDINIDGIGHIMDEGDGNILLVKLDSEGVAQWVKSLGGSLVQWGDYYGWPTDIISDAEGNTYIKGWCADSTYFGDIMLVSPIVKAGYNNRYNKFVAKINNEGNTIWAKSLSDIIASNDYNHFDIDMYGNVYCAYLVNDTTYFSDEYTYINSGLKDILMVKYSNDGDLNWVKSIKGSPTGTEQITHMIANHPDEVYAYGWFNNYLDFGSSIAIANNRNSFLGILDGSTGINEYQNNKKMHFTLYPNPSNQMVNILLDDLSNNATEVTINDLSGRNVYSNSFAKGRNQTTIDISELSSGVYFVKLQSGKYVGIKKLVVE